MLQVVCGTFFSRLSALVKDASIMQCTFDDLRKLKRQTNDVFSTWVERSSELRTALKVCSG